MEIKLLVRDLKQIYKVCGKILSKKADDPEIRKKIHLKTDGTTLTATATDGYMMNQLLLSNDSSPGEISIPIIPTKEFHDLSLATITSVENKVSIEIESMKIAYSNIYATDFDFSKNYPKTDPLAEIWINTKYLKKMCNSFNGIVKLSIYNRTSPLIIEQKESNIKGLIMPVYVRRDE